MPGPGLRFVAGMAVALATAACGSAPSPAAQTSSSPSPTALPTAPPTAAGGHNWQENLAFTGDLTGSLTTVVPDQPNQTSECTGTASRSAGSWSSAIYGTVGGTVYGVVLTAAAYRGPGTYKDKDVSVQVTSADHTHVWQSVNTDPVTFVVAADETSGTLDASLDNLTTGKTSLHVSGSWTCR